MLSVGLHALTLSRLKYEEHDKCFVTYVDCFLIDSVDGSDFSCIFAHTHTHVLYMCFASQIPFNVEVVISCILIGKY